MLCMLYSSPASSCAPATLLVLESGLVRFHPTVNLRPVYKYTVKYQLFERSIEKKIERAS